VSHRIDFSPEALGDLIDLYDYIAARDGAERAIGYIDRIEDPAPPGLRETYCP
jgi:plasmid stabilization system protein ParE